MTESNQGKPLPIDRIITQASELKEFDKAYLEFTEQLAQFVTQLQGDLSPKDNPNIQLGVYKNGSTIDGKRTTWTQFSLKLMGRELTPFVDGLPVNSIKVFEGPFIPNKSVIVTTNDYHFNRLRQSGLGGYYTRPLARHEIGPVLTVALAQISHRTKPSSLPLPEIKR